MAWKNQRPLPTWFVEVRAHEILYGTWRKRVDVVSCSVRDSASEADHLLKFLWSVDCYIQTACLDQQEKHPSAAYEWTQFNLVAILTSWSCRFQLFLELIEPIVATSSYILLVCGQLVVGVHWLDRVTIGIIANADERVDTRSPREQALGARDSTADPNLHKSKDQKQNASSSDNHLKQFVKMN